MKKKENKNEKQTEERRNERKYMSNSNKDRTKMGEHRKKQTRK